MPWAPRLIFFNWDLLNSDLTGASVSELATPSLQALKHTLVKGNQFYGSYLKEEEVGLSSAIFED